MVEPGLSLVLWGLALLVYGVGDVVTTAVGIRYYDLRETNPLAVRLMGPSPSFAQTVTFKLAMLAVAAVADGVISALVGFPGSILVPFLVLGIGVWAVQANVLNLWLAHRRRADG